MIDMTQQHILFREGNSSFGSILDGVTILTLFLRSLGLSHLLLLFYLMYMSHVYLIIRIERL